MTQPSPGGYECDWDGGGGSIELLRCKQCSSWFHLGTFVCSRCLSVNLVVERTTNVGRLVATTVVQRSFGTVVTWSPYVIGLLEIVGGLKLLGVIVAGDEPPCGALMEIQWLTVSPGDRLRVLRSLRREKEK